MLAKDWTELAETTEYAAPRPQPVARAPRLTSIVLQASRADADGLPVVGSVKRAIEHLRNDPNVSADLLAGIAGVTPARLRRNFKECLGVTLAAFIRRERLEWARRRLVSNAECRSISELARACGMESSVFTRAYQCRFRETPTHTRTRAFASSR